MKILLTLLTLALVFGTAGKRFAGRSGNGLTYQEMRSWKRVVTNSTPKRPTLCVGKNPMIVWAKLSN
jgi:hypothetical protein